MNATSRTGVEERMINAVHTVFISGRLNLQHSLCDRAIGPDTANCVLGVLRADRHGRHRSQQTDDAPAGRKPPL
eukprot:scaffold196267_cov32-Tisochrysis_lutea.AAC.10